MESSKSDSESPDQAEFRGDNKCAQCMQVLYLQSEQVNGIHNLEDIHIQSSTSTATVPTVDHFFRVEWTAAFPLWTLNLAQRDTVHGARWRSVAVFSVIYSCTGTVLYSRILLASTAWGAHLQLYRYRTSRMRAPAWIWSLYLWSQITVLVPPYEYDRILQLYQLSCTSSA